VVSEEKTLGQIAYEAGGGGIYGFNDRRQRVAWDDMDPLAREGFEAAAQAVEAWVVPPFAPTPAHCGCDKCMEFEPVESPEETPRARALKEVLDWARPVTEKTAGQAHAIAKALEAAAISDWDADDGKVIEIYVSQIAPIVERILREGGES